MLINTGKFLLHIIAPPLDYARNKLSTGYPDDTRSSTLKSLRLEEVALVQDAILYRRGSRFFNFSFLLYQLR